MLWIALHLPQLSLDLIEATARHAEQITGVTSLPGTPIAIGDRLSILNVNHCAQQAGVHPGMKRATAQALAPDIQLIDYDPVREQQALRSLACRVLRLTPSVSFTPPPLPGKKPLAVDDAPLPAPGQAGLLLEVQASLRYFGGLPALLAQIENELQLLGFHANCGLAPTPTAAWLLAQYHQCSPAQLVNDAHSPHWQDINALPDQLAPLPVSLLSHAQPHEAALSSIGARNISQLLDLPRAGLARRFGKQLLLEVDCALGSQAQPIGFFHAPEQFSSQLQLLSNIEKVDELLVAAQHLLIELSGWLQARHAAVRVFDLIVLHEDPPATSMTVRLSNYVVNASNHSPWPVTNSLPVRPAHKKIWGAYSNAYKYV